MDCLVLIKLLLMNLLKFNVVVSWLKMKDHGGQERAGKFSANCNHSWWAFCSTDWSAPACREILSCCQRWSVRTTILLFHHYRLINSVYRTSLTFLSHFQSAQYNRKSRDIWLKVVLFIRNCKARHPSTYSFAFYNTSFNILLILICFHFCKGLLKWHCKTFWLIYYHADDTTICNV